MSVTVPQLTLKGLKPAKTPQAFNPKPYVWTVGAEDFRSMLHDTCKARGSLLQGEGLPVNPSQDFHATP